jgi:anthranilate phosphoribosyltransferase
MKFAAPLRPQIGTRTVFNLLGPLTNPAGARHQLLGVPHASFGQKMAEALAGLGTAHALVVSGDGNMDELTLSGPSHVWEVQNGDVRSYVLDAEDMGLQRAPRAAVVGGDVPTNVRIIRDVLGGREGAPLDAVLLNAGAALYAADRVRSIGEGVACAREIVRSGAAARKLEAIVAWGAEL